MEDILRIVVEENGFVHKLDTIAFSGENTSDELEVDIDSVLKRYKREEEDDLDYAMFAVYTIPSSISTNEDLMKILVGAMINKNEMVS